MSKTRSAEWFFSQTPWLPVVGLIIIFLAAFGVLALAQGERIAGDVVSRSNQIKLNVAQFDSEIIRYESAGRGYLNKPLPMLLEDMEDARRAAFARLDVLARETLTDTRQRAHLARLKPLLDERIQIMTQWVSYQQQGQLAVALQREPTPRGPIVSRLILAETAAMMSEEDRILIDQQAKAQRLSLLVSSALAGAVVLVIVVTLLMLRDADTRYRLVAEALEEVRAAENQLRAEQQARLAAEGQLLQVQKMETIGQLTGGIAHDFNNMMAIVIGNLDMAMRRIDQPDRLIQSISHAREGADRAAALTARLMAFARRQPLEPVAIDGDELLAGMSDMLHRTIGEDIAIETSRTSGLWRCFADPVQLENAILNLAVNARDAIAAGLKPGGTLTIKTANVDLDEAFAQQHMEVAPGDYVMFAVSDTGQGMDPDTLSHAFEPFFTTKAVGHGTGLGLSQVFGFAKQSGGHVDITSDVGRGTTVRLYLPRRYDDGVQASPAMAGTPPTGRSEEIILVVEDEQRVRQLTVDALRDLGYTAISASNGAEALLMLDAHPSIRMLLTDIVMPELNGRDLAEAAKARRPDMCVLFMSGFAPDVAAHGGTLEVGQILPKPFRVDGLAWKVRKVLDDSVDASIHNS